MRSGDAHDNNTRRRQRLHGVPGGARAGEDHQQDRYARCAGARVEERAQTERLFHRRYRRARDRDGVLVRNHGPNRQRLSAPRSSIFQGARRVTAGAAERAARHAVSGHVRPHSARATGGRGGRRRHASSGRAGQTRDGQHGYRLHGGVPDADAAARHASSGRGGGGAGPRVQSLARRGTVAARDAHQGDDVPAVQRSRSLRRGGGGVCRRTRRHRLHRGLDPLQAGASQQLHAALCRAAGDGQAAGVSLGIPLGRRVR